MPKFAVILPAAGSSTRYGRNKLLETLAAERVLRRTVMSLWNHEWVGEIFVATDDVEVIELLQALPQGPREEVHRVRGGNSRAESVRFALERVPSSYEWVAVHDAARPLISAELLDRTFAAALAHGASAPALPVSSTIKQATGPLPARVQRTIPRHDLWAMQTPQVMRRDALLRAYERCPIALDQVTDDAQLLELAGDNVWLVPGDERNIKITTPADLQIAESFLAK